MVRAKLMLIKKARMEMLRRDFNPKEPLDPHCLQVYSLLTTLLKKSEVRALPRRSFGLSERERGTASLQLTIRDAP